jgi:glycosyltransferase involved in cell wall biosynthesis
MRVSLAFAKPEGAFADLAQESGLDVLDLALGSGYDLRPRTIARLSGRIAEANAELLHLHGFNPALDAALQHVQRPVVFTEHGNFALGRRLGVRGRVKRHLARRFLKRRCDTIVANSAWTARQLYEIYGVRGEAVTVVYNGIDPATPMGRPRDPDGVVLVAFVGRLVPFKRVDRIIHAVAHSPRRGLRAMIIGGGPLELELRGLAQQLGVGDRVRFLGWRSDVATLLATADVLVLPSIGEPFGLALLEGCAQGLLPIAFTDGGGVLECVAPAGRVVRNVLELAETLKDLMGSELLSLAARQARSSWVRNEFPITKTAERYAGVYTDVIDGQG